MIVGNVTEFYRDPFPHGVIDDAVADPEKYAFPSHLIGDYRQMTGRGFNKHHLNEKHSEFAGAIAHEPWKMFYRWVTIGGFKYWCYNGFQKQISAVIPKPKSGAFPQMEFSAVPAAGGVLTPHTDSKHKILTVVWYHSGYPAGTKILSGEPRKKSEPWADENRTMLVRELAWRPNRMIFFLKTDASWHSVGPLDGPEGEFRNTVTLNLTANR